MTLHTLLTPDAALAWLHGHGVDTLTTDSRRVRPGAAFIAWPGHAVDGRRFIGAALQAGAAACLVEARGVERWELPAEAPIAALPDLKAATGVIASAFLGAPSERLQVLAVTGTNGKTSTAWWLAQALAALGRRCGVIGTLGIGEPPSAAHPEAQLVSTGLTTPDPVTLHAAFRRYADDGVTACAIEASSIGLSEHRLAGTRVEVALFTNFTQDHLDYHGSMDAYWQAKARLFDWPQLKAAVLNVDDARGAAEAQRLSGSALDVWTYASRSEARLRADDIRYVGAGLSFDVCEGAERIAVRTTLIGSYNVANLLAVIGGLRALGLPLTDCAAACSALGPVPGRMQRIAVAGNAPDVVVDYAHTPDALEQALLALQPFAAARGGRLWCVFGCGGNRDAGKRPLMGALAQRLADRTVITSDNPRDEAPAAILEQIRAGAGDDVEVIEDRRLAIRHAVAAAATDDVVLIAGKGHEDYQEIAGVRLPFSDVIEARAALLLRGGSA